MVYADSDDYPAIADVTADFVYARLQRTEEENETGYAAADLDRWAARARLWEAGGAPADLPQIDKKAAPKTTRPVFVYMISGAKVRAPAAAMALIERRQGMTPGAASPIPGDEKPVGVATASAPAAHGLCRLRSRPEPDGASALVL